MIHFLSGKPKIFWNLIKENILLNIKIWNINFKKKTNKTKIDDKIIDEDKNFIIKLEPVADILKNIKKNSKTKNTEVIYLSPQGKKISQNILKMIAFKKEIIFISGKNRGIDNRIVENLINKEISLGDYILNCGEFVFIILINALNRLFAGLENIDCVKKNSFENLLFDFPLYSKSLNIKNFRTFYNNLSYKKNANFKKKNVFLKTFLYRPDFKNGNNYEETI